MSLMNAIMLSCIKATELMEMNELVPLSLINKMQLRAHVAMCSGCNNYRKQTKLINKLLNKNFTSMASKHDTGELEADIIKKL